MKRMLGEGAVVFAGCVILAAPGPVHGPGPVLGAGPARDERYGFAFDVPVGCWAERDRSPGCYRIGLTGSGALLTLRADTGPLWFDGPLADPSDSLLSFAKQTMGWDCDADGPDGGQFADRLLAIHSFRSRHGFEVVEYSVRLKVQTRGGDGEDDEADSAGVSPIATEAGASDTTLTASASWHTAGPFYLADLGRPGSRLHLRISPDCSVPADPRVIRIARAFAGSLRRP